MATHTEIKPPRLRRWRAGGWLLPAAGTIVFLVALLWARNAGALPPARQVPPASPSTITVSYQGRLADAAGVPVDGLVTLQFALYATDVDPTPLWGPEIHPDVPVSEGLFSVSLGSQLGGIPQHALAGDLWLEIAVNGETLSPRERLASVPYAMQALTVPDGAMTTPKVALTSGQLGGAGDLVPGTDYQVVPGLTLSVTATTDQVLMVYATLDATDVSSNGALAGRVFVDDEATGTPMVLASTSDVRASISTSAYIPLVTGTHTVDVRVFVEGAAGGLIRGSGSTMTYFLMSQ